MGLLLMKFTYCRMISALILPIILANKPFVVLAKFLIIKNWSVSCENSVLLHHPFQKQVACVFLRTNLRSSCGHWIVCVIWDWGFCPYVPVACNQTANSRCQYFLFRRLMTKRHFLIRKFRNWATAWDISQAINKIFGIFLHISRILTNFV